MLFSVLLTILLIVSGYLIGSISFAVLVSRLMGLPSPHSYGSGNPGATNVLRSGRKLAALMTLIGDAVKGAVAIWIAQSVAANTTALNIGASEFVLAAVALAAFLGHLYPVYFRFRGGKGVATAAGILLFMSPAMGAAILGVWVVVALITRYSSLAALIAALAAAFLAVMVFGASWSALAVVCMSLLLLWRHRGNIAKLRAGTESRIEFGRSR